MSIIVDLILKYWVLIIILCVVVLMMIIGYYVEANGLVEDDKKEKKKQKPSEIDNSNPEVVQEESVEPEKVEDVQQPETAISDFDFPVNEENNIENVDNSDNELVQEEKSDITSEEPIVEEQFNIASEPESNTQVEVTNDIEEEVPEENFEEFEEYFEKVLPEEPVISDELKKYMDEFKITPLSLDKKQKGVDTNIKLPDIKQNEEEEDIWSL